MMDSKNEKRNVNASTGRTCASSTLLYSLLSCGLSLVRIACHSLEISLRCPWVLSSGFWKVAFLWTSMLYIADLRRNSCGCKRVHPFLVFFFRWQLTLTADFLYIEIGDRTFILVISLPVGMLLDQLVHLFLMIEKFLLEIFMVPSDCTASPPVTCSDPVCWKYLFYWFSLAPNYYRN